MATKPKSNNDSKTAAEANTLTATETASKSSQRKVAELGLSPMVASAITAQAFGNGPFGKMDLGDSIDVMREKIKKVEAGDLADVEATLTAQAVTLDGIFNELARRAAQNMGTHLNATETYLRLAFKAQGQCRATLETLTEVKYPRVATFVRQQNVAYQQQVNNSDAENEQSSTRRRARAEKNQNQQSKLLEDGPNGSTYLDTGTTKAPGRSNQVLEAVAPVHRSKKHRG